MSCFNSLTESADVGIVIGHNSMGVIDRKKFSNTIVIGEDIGDIHKAILTSRALVETVQKCLQLQLINVIICRGLCQSHVTV